MDIHKEIATSRGGCGYVMRQLDWQGWIQGLPLYCGRFWKFGKLSNLRPFLTFILKSKSRELEHFRQCLASVTRLKPSDQSRRKDPPYPPVGGPHACSGASCCVGEPFWAHQNAKNQICWSPGLRPGPRWGSLQRSPRPPSWWGGAPRGFCCPPPQEPHLQYCHRACPVCMYTRVWKYTVVFSWMLNTGPHSCIWGGTSNYLAPALLVTDPCSCTVVPLHVCLLKPAGESWKLFLSQECTKYTKVCEIWYFVIIIIITLLTEWGLKEQVV